jgi:hypothetical protein
VAPEDGTLIPEVLDTAIYTDTSGSFYLPPLLARFSEPISATTVTSQTVTLTTRDGQPVAVDLGYDGVSYQTTIRLREPLEERTRYAARITGDVKDLSGNGLEADYVWTFETGPIPSPVYVPLVLRDAKL